MKKNAASDREVEAICPCWRDGRVPVGGGQSGNTKKPLAGIESDPTDVFIYATNVSKNNELGEQIMAVKTTKRPKKSVKKKSVGSSRVRNTGSSSRDHVSGRKKKSGGASPRTTDVYDRERTRHQERGSSSRFVGFKEDGKTKIRVVTFMHNKQECAFEPNFMHFNVPGDRKAVRCPESDCPICALESEVPEAVWKGNTAGRGGIKPSRRFVCNAVVRKGPNQPQDELKQMELPWSVWDGIEKAREDGEIKDAFHLKKGVDFLVSRETKNNFTKYTVTAMQTSKPVTISIEPVDLIEALGGFLELKALDKIADAIYAEVE